MASLGRLPGLPTIIPPLGGLATLVVTALVAGVLPSTLALLETLGSDVIAAAVLPRPWDRALLPEAIAHSLLRPPLATLEGGLVATLVAAIKEVSMPVELEPPLDAGLASLPLLVRPPCIDMPLQAREIRHRDTAERNE